MIVKDEAHVITRCLESVLPFIDTFCIVDTGSTDDTVELIEGFFESKGIDGKVYKREWKDFAFNRTQAIDLAKNFGDYLLWIDADDILEFPENYRRPHLTEHAYYFQIKYGGMAYARVCMVKNDGSWKYEGVLHEYPVSRKQSTPVQLPGVTMRILGGGGRSLQDDRVKYAADAQTLIDAITANKDSHLVPRYTFYAAQSFRDAQEWHQAESWYLARTEQEGFDQEVYFSYLQYAVMGELLERDDVVERYQAAINNRPDRAEAVVNLASYLRRQEQYGLAFVYATYASSLPLSGDALFVDVASYTWRGIDEYAVSAFYLGKYNEAITANRALLGSEHLPETERERVLQNLKFALDKRKGL